MDLETFLGAIIGAIIAGGIGILTARYAISRKEKTTKKTLQKLSLLKLRRTKNVYVP